MISILSLFGCDTPKDHRQLNDSDQSEVIYGTNSIKNILLDKYKNLPDKKKNIMATVALIDQSNFIQDKKKMKLITEVVQEKYQVCKNTLYSEEKTAAFCTGVLIRPNLVLTAAHCLNNGLNGCDNTKFLFNFRNETVKNQEVSPSDLYSCKKIIYLGKEAEGIESDFAIVQLDRSAAVEPVQLDKQASRTTYLKNQKVYTVGYPIGTAQKIASGEIRTDDDDENPMMNLDVFFGNSGGPIFDEKTNQLIGLLSSGEDDFIETRGGCYQAKKCQNGQCLGERLVNLKKITEILELYYSLKNKEFTF